MHVPHPSIVNSKQKEKWSEEMLEGREMEKCRKNNLPTLTGRCNQASGMGLCPLDLLHFYVERGMNSPLEKLSKQLRLREPLLSLSISPCPFQLSRLLPLPLFLDLFLISHSTRILLNNTNPFYRFFVFMKPFHSSYVS